MSNKINKDDNGSIKSFLRLIRYTFRYKWQMALILVCVLISTVSQIYAINMLRPIIDEYIIPADFNGLKIQIFKMLILFLISATSAYVYMRLMVRVGEKSIRDIRLDLFTKLQHLKVNFFDENPHGEILSRLTNDTDMLSESMASTVPSILSSSLLFIGTMIVMFKINAILTAVTLTALILTLLTLGQIVKRTGGYFMNAQRQIGVIHGFNEEMLSGQKVIKVFNHESQAIEQFDVLSEQLRKNLARAMTSSGKIMPFLINMLNVIYAIICMVGVVVSAKGFLSIGSLATFLTNARQLQNPIANVAQQTNGIFQAMAGAGRIFQILDMEEEVDDGSIDLVNALINEDGSIEESDKITGNYAWKFDQNSKSQMRPLRGKIDFEHVNFSYDGKNPILKDVTFYANPGEKLALVGSTGAGKTTITNVITRFYEIDSGAIKIDDIDIRDIKKSGLRRAFGMVLQEVNLFTDTVENNIRYGKLDAHKQEIVKVGELFGADSFIKRLPEGYHTVIRGDGSSLSNGQNQLIGILRAAINKSGMLILDEATSSIDISTEMLVTEAMDKLMERSTSIVIAHRLSTIQNADVIMVMEGGRIIERGNHESLLNKKGTYYQLYTGKLELD
ncbi:MAG: ABC transporter ATP-binding protein [Finegoldia sp.]|nr:ABC transporter ATP-binding protein [Finegoldia sp.]